MIRICARGFPYFADRPCLPSQMCRIGQIFALEREGHNRPSLFAFFGHHFRILLRRFAFWRSEGPDLGRSRNILAPISLFSFQKSLKTLLVQKCLISPFAYLTPFGQNVFVVSFNLIRHNDLTICGIKLVVRLS